MRFRTPRPRTGAPSPLPSEAAPWAPAARGSVRRGAAGPRGVRAPARHRTTTAAARHAVAPHGPVTERPAATAGAGCPVTSQPEDQRPVPEISTTPSGLPVRVPQANLTPSLAKGEQPDAVDEADGPARSPEEVQRIMDAYQLGTRRGRSAAAARATEDEDDQ
jgi:hypothetical protein